MTQTQAERLAALYANAAELSCLLWARQRLGLATKRDLDNVNKAFAVYDEAAGRLIGPG